MVVLYCTVLYCTVHIHTFHYKMILLRGLYEDTSEWDVSNATTMRSVFSGSVYDDTSYSLQSVASGLGRNTNIGLDVFLEVSRANMVIWDQSLLIGRLVIETCRV
jgi:hypothetical protein